MWNSLPANLRQMTSYGQFRRHLKAHLFRTFYKSQRTVTLILCAIEPPSTLTYLPLCIQHDGREAARRAGLSAAAETCWNVVCWRVGTAELR